MPSERRCVGLAHSEIDERESGAADEEGSRWPYIDGGCGQELLRLCTKGGFEPLQRRRKCKNMYVPGAPFNLVLIHDPTQSGRDEKAGQRQHPGQGSTNGCGGKDQTSFATRPTQECVAPTATSQFVRGPSNVPRLGVPVTGTPALNPGSPGAFP